MTLEWKADGTGDPQVVKLVKGSDYVYIMASKVEENLTDPSMITIERAFLQNDNTKSKQGTLIIKLNRFKHSYNIQGYLSAEQGSGNESLETAKAVRTKLVKDIMGKPGDIELHYRDYVDSDSSDVYGDDNASTAGVDHVKCQVSKVSITDAALRADYLSGASMSVARYNIDLELIRGKTK